MALRRFASILVLALSFSGRAAAQVEVQKLLAGDGRASDVFGKSVAVSGDRALVGQTGLLPQDGGSVYAFQRGPSGWIETQVLGGSDTASGDWFGFSAAISGTTAAVGTLGHDHAGIGGTGAVYLFEFEQGAWHEVQELVNAPPAPGDGFGTAVAMDGDVLVVGASGCDTGGLHNAGLVCVYERRPNGWIRTAALTPSDVAANDTFGNAVAVSGTTLVAGKSRDAGHRGAAYVFEKTPQGWVETEKLVASDGAPIDQFGWSVDIEGDRALVGAPVARAAYLFERTSSGWVERRKLTPADAPPDSDFGRAVLLEGETALVGMPMVSTPDQEGAVYVHRLGGGAWPLFAKLSDAGANNRNAFGESISADGETLFAGALWDDDLGNLSGSACVFQLPGFAQPYGYCAGAGVCGNDDAVAGCANSTERGARLGACGSGSLARDDFALVAERMPPARPVVFFRGGAATAAPLGDGFRHVGPGSVGLRRFAPTVASPHGTSLLGPGILAGSGIHPGQTWFFQAWYADPSGPCGTGVNASNALRAVFGP